MTTFEIGKTYYMRSICDSECIWKFTVVKRTAKTITIADEDGKTKNCRISSYWDEEHCKPLGSYSMAPTLSASNVA